MLCLVRGVFGRRGQLLVRSALRIHFRLLSLLEDGQLWLRFYEEIRTPQAACGPMNTDADGTRAERSSTWVDIVPADGTKAANWTKRRLRYVAVF
jgi:hypothetical protein